MQAYAPWPTRTSLLCSMSAQVASARQSTRELPTAHLVAMRAFLRGYNGILNFNYKVRPGGELCLFEINTRAGADLGCDVPTPMMREFFRKLDELELDEPAQAPSCTHFPLPVAGAAPS